MTEKNIILFDGVCNLCVSSVQFIIKRDPVGIFYFASLQSDVGVRLSENFGALIEKTDSIILIKGDKCYIESDAALKIASKLKGGWKLLYIFIIIPKPLRDAVYRYVARNRYKWFGKKDACMIPSPDLKKRFME
ncbi:MAG TPA: thiol-disulfide oxidoreductase DCC family protein [Ignavibacteriaceae bacterium]|nr:thiol-disulfide oxidoreductase DCC family protein [Ignavibacteriaceae bacterium]